MFHTPIPRDILRTLASRIAARSVEQPNGCIIFPGRGITAHTRYYNPRVVVWMREHGYVPERRFVLPTCGNMKCVNPAHLALSEENCNFLPGRSYQHQANNRYTALSDNQVRRLRSEPPERTNTELAGEYGISAVRIAEVRRGTSYRWVK